jgi:hypothetical protein
VINAHFDASNVGVAGGGPDDDIVRASEIYADDAVVEWPQGGERLLGKANIIAMRSTYPTRQQFELHRTTGCHDLWVNEYTIRYDDQTVMVVGIMEFRDDKVVRERIYFGDPWDPPAWRAQWVERFDPLEPDSPVAAHEPGNAAVRLSISRARRAMGRAEPMHGRTGTCSPRCRRARARAAARAAAPKR